MIRYDIHISLTAVGFTTGGRMPETRMVKEIHSWKPTSEGPTGRPKTRWEDDVKKDIQKLKVPHWRTLVQDRRR
jgi:hypothetical protein